MFSEERLFIVSNYYYYYYFCHLTQGAPGQGKVCELPKLRKRRPSLWWVEQDRGREGRNVTVQALASICTT